MNKFTRNMKVSPASERQKQHSGKRSWVGSFVIWIVVAAVFGFGAFCVQINLKAQTERLYNQTVLVEQQIQETQNKITNLRTQREELCSWNNIRRNITRQQLPLVQRTAAQITKLKRFHGIAVSGAPVATVRAENKNNHGNSYAANTLR